MSDPFPWIAEELETLAEQGLLRERRTARRLAGGWCEVDGRRLVDFASNDYLGLSHHPHVVAAAQRAIAECGTGSGASALVVGRSILARTLGTSPGPLRRAGGRDPVSDRLRGQRRHDYGARRANDDAIYSDSLNHASLIDGCRLSGAAVHVYDHRRLDEPGRSPGGRSQLPTATDRDRRRLQHGRRARAAARVVCPGSRHDAAGPGRRGARHGRLRPPRTGHARTAGSREIGRRPRGHVEQGHRRRRWIRHRQPHADRLALEPRPPADFFDRGAPAARAPRPAPPWTSSKRSPRSADACSC